MESFAVRPRRRANANRFRNRREPLYKQFTGPIVCPSGEMMGQVMKTSMVAAVTALMLVTASQARADSFNFLLSGAGITGSIAVTTSPDTVAGDPAGAFTVDSISGVFSDSNIGINNATVTGLVPIAPVSPPYGPPFPVSLSFLSVLNPPPFDSAISYDNLFYPDGSPITCTDYGLAGGWMDVYGLLFTLDNGDAVDLFSNGGDANNPLNYGAVVINLDSSGNTVLDNQAGDVFLPEPATWGLMLAGIAGLGGLLRRRGVSPSA